VLAFDKNMDGARADNRTSALHATHVLVRRHTTITSLVIAHLQFAVLLMGPFVLLVR